MSLLLTLERGPRPQSMHEARLDDGELVIGRSASADWHIDDPDMFVSRAHCTVRGGREGYFVTDTSSSGLFIDDSPNPLGAGNSAPLHHGMRLRLGDYVLWVDIQDDAAKAASERDVGATEDFPRPSGNGFGGDDFFSVPVPEQSQGPRPTSLPDPFDQPAAGAYAKAQDLEPQRPSSPGFDDPFSLDPLPSQPHPTDPAAGFDDFSAPAPDLGRTSEFPGDNVDGHFDFASSPGLSSSPAVRGIPPGDDFLPSVRATAEPAQARHPEPGSAAEKPALGRPAPRAEIGIGLDAFLRAAGIDPRSVPDAEAEIIMAKLGREYRAMMDGLMLLLRKRAEEKNNARVAATVVGASEVNPLKFMPRVEDALEIVISGRSPGFLSGEDAIEDAVRDLAHHHLRAWRGIQTALRRMVDRFDPARIEQELKDTSAVGALLTGGRGAKLWELYKKRHREISRSAEERFMGEVGADFRDAYEEE